MFGKTGIWLVITAATAMLSFAAVQDLPQGDGKDLVEARCTLCHGADLITGSKLDRDGWKDMVQKMVGYGTQLDEKESNTVVDYLAKNFAKPGAAGTASAAGGPSAADEKTALRYINGICSSCHDADLIKGTQATKEEWLDITNRMNGKGAGLSEQDVAQLVNYLAQKYPKKE